MMKTLLVGFVLLFVGCATFPSDNVSKEHYDSLKGNFDIFNVTLKGVNMSFMDVVYVVVSPSSYSVDKLSLTKTVFASATFGPHYQLRLDYVGGAWRFMNSLVMSVDGNITSFSDPNPNRVIGNGNVYETLYFDVTEDFVQSLAAAKEIQCEYYLKPVSLTEHRIQQLHADIALLKTLTYGSKVP